MATHSTNILTAGNPLQAFGNAVLAWMERLAEARSRRSQITTLEAKSDAELAELGMTRDTISHYVFRDLYYI